MRNVQRCVQIVPLPAVLALQEKEFLELSSNTVGQPKRGFGRARPHHTSFTHTHSRHRARNAPCTSPCGLWHSPVCIARGPGRHATPERQPLQAALETGSSHDSVCRGSVRHCAPQQCSHDSHETTPPLSSGFAPHLLSSHAPTPWTATSPAPGGTPAPPPPRAWRGRGPPARRRSA